MENLHKNIQLMLELILVLHFSFYTIMTYDVICNIGVYADDTTLCSKRDQACDLWQWLELASELESDLWDTVDWGKKWCVDFKTGKTQLVLFDQSNNTGAIDVKMDGFVVEEKVILQDAGFDFLF